MASKMLRRSGVSVGLVAELLGWKADQLWQVGVGFHHEEVGVLMEEWGLEKENIVGFEANPTVFEKIWTSYPGQLVNLAITDQTGSRHLWFHHHHKDGSSLKGLDHANCEAKVECTALDQFGCHPEGEVLLWLDCEGSELDVLNGANEFLKHVAVINVEMTANPPGPGWPSTETLHDRLVQLGYWRQWIHTQRATLGQYDGIYVRPHLFKPEYCCCPYTLTEWRRTCTTR